MWLGRDLWVQRDDGRSTLCQVTCHRIFSGKPFEPLARSSGIGDNADHKGFCEPDDKSAGVLQDFTSIRVQAMADGDLGGGSDGKLGEHLTLRAGTLDGKFS